MIPVPTPEQSVHVLEILGEWTKRGWWYEAFSMTRPSGHTAVVHYSDPDAGAQDPLVAKGVNHFDALCQATTVMQVLLEEHPKEA